MTRMVDEAFLARLQGASLVTAHILYRLPDYRNVLQEFIWQDYDLAPDLPRLKSFMHFWEEKIEGRLFRVTVCCDRLVRPAELRLVGGEFRLQ